MAILTLPTSLLPLTGVEFALPNEVIVSGRAIFRDDSNHVGKAAARLSTTRRIIGIAVSGVEVVGQWLAYVPAGGVVRASGLVKGTVYYLAPGTDEVQTVTITGGPTGGTFTLTFQGRTTAAIAYNAANAAVQSALELLSNIGSGGVVVAGGPLPGTPVTVTFKGPHAATNQPEMTAAHAFTGGASPAVAVTTSTPGDRDGKLAALGDLVSGDFLVLAGAALSTTDLLILGNDLGVSL